MSKLMDKMGVKANRACLQVKKHSPEIIFGLGVVGFIGTVVVATRRSLKAKEVLENHRKEISEIKEASQQDEQYAAEYRKQDMLGSYGRTTVGLTKAYAPVVALGVLSLGCFAYSNHILKGRYLVAVSAYNAVSGAFETYRKRVRDEEGADADRHYLLGTERQIIEKTEVDENGKKKKVKEEVEILVDSTDHEFIRFFEEGNPRWDPDPGLSLSFLKAQEDIYTNILHTRGHVFLNEVLEGLGFDHTQVGAVSGWIMGAGDDFVDFGIHNYREEALRRVVNGEANVIPLSFNCDGMIMDKI